MENKKIKISSELVFLLATVILSFSVAMIATTDFGVSMIVAPAYILSQKFTFLTFGQSEYIIQAILFIVFCIAMKKVKLIYFCSFLSGIIYGAILDLWRLIPIFNQNITTSDDLNLAVKIVFFTVGMLLSSLSIAMYFKTYIYPQVYDFFVKGVSEKYNINRVKFKTCFDASFLLIATALTLLFFKSFVGINFGTIIMTVLNGTIIGFFSSFLDKHFEFVPTFKSLAKYFELN